MNPEFPDLESVSAQASRERAPLSVTELNRAVARTLERSFPLVHVRGEISNLTRAASGHWYFSLKDEGAQVRCAMFRARAQYAEPGLREGDAVEVRAQVRLYEARGDYQLVVDAIRRAGRGGLLEAFVRLKERLAAEGLFDSARKKPLPGFVRTVGIVSSREAAALRDVATTLAERAPHVRSIVYPTPVQGEGAAAKIAAAIALANARRETDGLDLLIVCRGGGSLEDLWAFNEEVVARAIAASALPVISGVGHETDTTIADFVADVRAPTPTGAAHMATRARADWREVLENCARRAKRSVLRDMEQKMLLIDAAAARLISPAQRLAAAREHVVHLAHRMRGAFARKCDAAQARIDRVAGRHVGQRPDIDAGIRHVANIASRMRLASVALFDAQATRVARYADVLDAISPQATLRRGYSMVLRDGHVLAKASDARVGDRIEVRLIDGSLDASVEEIRASGAEFGG